MTPNVTAHSEASGPEVPGEEVPGEDVRVRRVAERASYDAQSINEILDAGLVAHVGTVRDGQPVVIPMFYVRDGDHLLLHGAPATGAIRRGTRSKVCVTVTHIDGLVLARSAFHHSMNYRSVVVIGTAEPIDDPDEKSAALERFVEALVPGRTADLRPNTKKEIAATGVLRLSLDQASAKVRTGGPNDDDDDYALPIWAGVVPMTTTIGTPQSDPRNLPDVATPHNVIALEQP